MQIVKKYSNGDTIIEVLFAVSIFSLVAVGGLSIMNKGNAITQRSLEITLVRQQIDAQAEILRFLNSSYIRAFAKDVPTDYYNGTPAHQWAKMKAAIPVAPADASDFGVTTNNKCPELKADSFVFDTSNADFVKLTNTNFLQPTSFSQIRFDPLTASLKSSDGLWIEAVKPTAPGDIGYIDFHIRACWLSVGQSVPMTIGTIVRLYEPL